jgi:iron complex outermembrane recepter protein
MRYCKVLLCCVCALASRIPLVAQDCHLALRGRVTEADTRQPLSLATIRIVETGESVLSDGEGLYAIANLCDDRSYTIAIDHVDCAHTTRIIRLTENTAIDFALSHGPVLQEVLVREKAIAPLPMQAEMTVSAADLAATRSAGLGEMLRRLPGVALLNTGATIAKPVIQGLHSNRVAVVSNNVAIEGQQWGADHAPEVDLFSTGQVKVVKGPAALRYGVGALGGAVVLEPAPLRANNGVGGWLALGGQTNGRGGVAAGAADWRRNNLTLRLQGTLKRTGNLRAPGYWLDNTGMGERNAMFLTEWRRGRSTHTWSAAYFSQQLGILRAGHIGNTTDLLAAIQSPTPLNNADSFAYTIDRPRQTVAHTVLKYNFLNRINERWKLTTQYSFQFNDRAEYDVVRRSGNAAARPQVTFRLWTNTLDAALEHFPIRHWQGGVGAQMTQQTNFVGRGGYIPDYRTLAGAVWANERWRRFPNPWEVQVGGRIDYRIQQIAYADGTFLPAGQSRDTAVAFLNATGSVGLLYHFSKKMHLALQSSYAQRPPHVYEAFARGVHFATATYEEGNRYLRSERAWNTQLSWRYTALRATAVVTVYANRIRDFMFLSPQATPVLTVRGAFPAFRYEQADALLRGMDAQAEWSINRFLAVEGRVALLRGQRKAPQPGEDRYTWLPLLPADRWQYGVRYTIGVRRRQQPEMTGEAQTAGIVLRAWATTVATQSRYPAEGLPLPPPPGYTLFNFDAAHTFYLTKHYAMETGLGVQNLTNVRYREYLNFFRYFADEPGMNLTLRIRLIFG